VSEFLYVGLSFTTSGSNEVSTRLPLWTTFGENQAFPLVFKGRSMEIFGTGPPRFPKGDPARGPLTPQVASPRFTPPPPLLCCGRRSPRRRASVSKWNPGSPMAPFYSHRSSRASSPSPLAQSCVLGENNRFRGLF